jgi:hypothetical protein
MARLYAVIGVLVLAALGWAQLTGWVLTGVDEAKGVPKSIRDNPGSYRSAYGWARPFTGAK